MAETKVIEIRTLEAIQNVRDLKDNIAALKAKIDDVDTSTEEYSELTKQLSQNQAALRNVMNGTNSTFETSIQDAQGLSTSYNSLVQQLKEATQEWRAIPKYLTEADRAQGIVNNAWQDAAGKVFDLRTELKSMDADTNSFVRNVGNYKSALEGFGGAMGQVKQVGGDMVNGLSAAASSLAILGINTEGLDDSMKNLRVVLAAVQGAKGFAGLLSQLKNYFTAGKNATKVTQQQTAATQAQTVAQTAANVATKEGTVAMTGLQKALIATGIGALVVALGMLVAHFEDIVKWVGGVLEKFGILKKSTDDLKDANKKLNDKFEEQNHALANQQKLLSAQGTSNKTLLIQKQQLINSQINDTKVTIENVKARIKQIEADARWWKFWQGTKGKLKEANEELAELEKTLKTLQQSAEDIDIDIKVEDITAGRNAAERAAAQAKKDAEDALNTAKKLLGDANKVVTDAMRAEETELERINRVHRENVALINSALTATENVKELEAERAKLEANKGAEDLRYRNELEAYYKKDFEGQAAKKESEIAESTQKTMKATIQYNRVMEEILGRTLEIGEATREQTNRKFDLANYIKYLKEELEKDGVSPLDILTSKTLSDEELRKKWGEPTATKLRIYLQKSDEFDELGIEILKTIFGNFEQKINDLIGEGRFNAARELANSFLKEFKEEFERYGVENKELAEIFQNNIFNAISEAAQESPRVGLLETVISDTDVEDLKDRVKSAKGVVDILFEDIKGLRETNYLGEFLGWKKDATEEETEAIRIYEEALLHLDVLEEQLFKKRIKRFEENAGEIAKYFNSYGKSTSNLLDNVADAWEASLQAQVKAGKRSEESAKDSFEAMKTLQYASAVINTAAAVVQALADPSVPSYYVKAANAVAALAAGTAQVIKISQTEFSSNASSNTVSAPAPVDRTPQLNYTIGLNTQEYAQAAAQNPIHCYITDKELNDGLEQYNKREGETTF